MYFLFAAFSCVIFYFKAGRYGKYFWLLSEIISCIRLSQLCLFLSTALITLENIEAVMAPFLCWNHDGFVVWPDIKFQ